MKFSSERLCVLLAALVDCLPSKGLHRTLRIQLKKKQEIKKLVNAREYDTNLTKYISRMLNLVFQGMTENINTKEQVSHISYKDMENLEFQIMFRNNYYTNSNSMHICFSNKNKKAIDKNSDIDTDLIPVNNLIIKKLT